MGFFQSTAIVPLGGIIFGPFGGDRLIVLGFLHFWRSWLCSQAACVAILRVLRVRIPWACPINCWVVGVVQLICFAVWWYHAM